MRNREDEDLKQIPTSKASDDPGEFKSPDPEPSNTFWQKMKWLHERGLHKGDYQEYEKPYYNLNKGAHYFVMDDPRKHTIKCVSCPVKHGGILEAHKLSRYTLSEGVLSLDGKAINQVPENFNIGE